MVTGCSFRVEGLEVNYREGEDAAHSMVDKVLYHRYARQHELVGKESYCSYRCLELVFVRLKTWIG